jgi:hypothetical protein
MFGENSRDYPQGLGWKMLIGKIVIEDAHLKRGDEHLRRLTHVLEA